MSGCGRTGEDNRIVNMAINVCYELHIGTAMVGHEDSEEDGRVRAGEKEEGLGLNNCEMGLWDADASVTRSTTL